MSSRTDPSRGGLLRRLPGERPGILPELRELRSLCGRVVFVFLAAYLLALGSAVLYKAADFLGGVASRRASTILVVVIAQAAGLLPLAGVRPPEWKRSPGNAGQRSA